MRQPRRFAVITVWLICLSWHVVLAAQLDEPEQVQIDALQCWRDLGSHSVRVGEQFTMMVTCGVIETDAATTVPNEVALSANSIDLSPFEIVGGQRFPDVRDGPWRFFQYQYIVRVIDENLFGQDVEIPALELQYHIERRLDGGSTLPGRELRYTLAPIPIRILSLVPEDAENIRELAGETFGAVDARLFRANLAVLVAAAIGVVAVGFLILALLRLREEWRGPTPESTQLIPVSVVVRRALKELTALQDETQEQGWNPSFVGRTLAALRLAGAAALSAPIAEEPVRAGHAYREGQLHIKRGTWRRRSIALSAAVTAGAIATEIEHRRGRRPDDAWLDRLETLQAAFHTFTVARYSPHGSVPTEKMTSELDRVIGVVRELRLRALAPVKRTARLVESVRHWWSEVWAS
mgnify:CR=1 FL=1